MLVHIYMKEWEIEELPKLILKIRRVAMRSRIYKEVITATSVKKFKKNKNVESFTVLQLRINRFSMIELHVASFDNSICATSNFITKLPYIKWKKDFTLTQKIFSKAEELFNEADEIVCGFEDKDIFGFASAYRQFRGTYINESHVHYDEIFEGKEIVELLTTRKNPRDIIENDFVVTQDMAETLAAVVMDDDADYDCTYLNDDLVRASMFLLEQTARKGYDPNEVLESIIQFHEMEVGEAEIGPVYLRKPEVMAI